MKTTYLFIIGMFFPLVGKEVDEKDKVKQVKIGNFSLPVSQQPGPLIGFGQNILDKGDLVSFLYLDQLGGVNKSFTQVAPSILYAIRDNFSIFIELPIAAKFKLNNNVTRSLEDLIVQLEYAPYNKDTTTTGDMISLVVNMGFPTGLALKEPPTGFGAPSFFMGFTATHVETDWYYFTSFGSTVTTSHKNTKFGNQFLYQFGLSKNIRYAPDAYIFNWMIELDGTYKQRNKIRGFIDQNSGGNEVLLGPSLWFSTEHFIAQGGISFFISQHSFGIQEKDRYRAAFNFAWKF